MDTMKVTKLVGALCVAGLVFLFGKWGAEVLFHQGVPKMAHSEDGHGEEIAQAYTIETAATEDETVETEDTPSVALVGDATTGAKVFAKCKACHKIEAGANGTGPSLFAIVGRDIGVAEGFKYSRGMEAMEGVWDEATLDAFLEDVKGTVPGTKMSFPGLRKEQQRADLIAYLSTLK